MNSSNKRPVENFIIGKQGVTTILATGTLNNTNGNVNLADGQIGIVSDSIWGTVALNSMCDATPTVAEAPVIAIYQGTSNSASMNTATATYPLWVRPYERTAPIDGRSQTVTVTKQVARTPSHSIWIVGDATGNAGEINVLDETEYTITTSFRGYRIEEFFSAQQAASLIVSKTTPNFTDLGKTEAEGRSWLVHNLGYDINQNSTALNVNPRRPHKSPVLALAINTAGGSGTAIGGVDPITTGDSIAVVNTSGGLRSITLTEAMATAIKTASLALATGVIADLTWTIETIDLADAYTTTADILMLIALDEVQAYVDYIPQVKVRLEVGLTRGFDYTTVLNDEYTFANPGQGDGRSLNLLYAATQGQRKYNLRHTEDPVVNFSTTPFDTAITYCVYNIMHSNGRQVDSFNTIYSPFREIVAIPTFSSGTTANDVIGLLDTALNSWLGSTTHNNALIALN